MGIPKTQQHIPLIPGEILVICAHCYTVVPLNWLWKHTQDVHGGDDG